jgi:hypothetical protein
MTLLHPSGSTPLSWRLWLGNLPSPAAPRMRCSQGTRPTIVYHCWGFLASRTFIRLSVPLVRPSFSCLLVASMSFISVTQCRLDNRALLSHTAYHASFVMAWSGSLSPDARPLAPVHSSFRASISQRNGEKLSQDARDLALPQRVHHNASLLPSARQASDCRLN